MKKALTETGKSLAEALIIVAIIIVVAYAATGTWHIGFAVESGSMLPNMQVGDLIFVQAPQRTDIITCEEGKLADYKSFNGYGDVIIYRPNGLSSMTPIIHRAMYWVEEGDKIDGKSVPHAGYITKGDNKMTNLHPDQPHYEPVKPEWVVAIAKARVPYLGYPSLILKGLLNGIKEWFKNRW